MKKHNCYKNIIKKGRAHYVCDVCGEDVSLELAFMLETMGDKEFNKHVKVKNL